MFYVTCLSCLILVAPVKVGDENNDRPRECGENTLIADALNGSLPENRIFVNQNTRVKKLFTPIKSKFTLKRNQNPLTETDLHSPKKQTSENKSSWERRFRFFINRKNFEGIRKRVTSAFRRNVERTENICNRVKRHFKD